MASRSTIRWATRCPNPTNSQSHHLHRLRLDKSPIQTTSFPSTPPQMNPYNEWFYRKGCSMLVCPLSRSIASNTFDPTQSSPRPPSWLGIPPEAFPPPSRLHMINPPLLPQPFPIHPSHSFTPRRGRSSTSNLLQSVPPTPLQSEMRTLRVVGEEILEVMGTFSPLSTAILSCTPRPSRFPTPIHLPQNL